MTDATRDRAADASPDLHVWQLRFYVAVRPCPPLEERQVGEKLRRELTELGYEDVFVSVEGGSA